MWLWIDPLSALLGLVVAFPAYAAIAWLGYISYRQGRTIRKLDKPRPFNPDAAA